MSCILCVMGCGLQEFILAVVATANLQAKKKPKDTIVEKLEAHVMQGKGLACRM